MNFKPYCYNYQILLRADPSLTGRSLSYLPLPVSPCARSSHLIPFRLWFTFIFFVVKFHSFPESICTQPKDEREGGPCPTIQVSSSIPPDSLFSFIKIYSLIHIAISLEDLIFSIHQIKINARETKLYLAIYSNAKNRAY